MQLSFDQIVLYFLQRWEILVIILKHNEDHSPVWSWHLRSPILSPVKTQPLKISVIYEIFNFFYTSDAVMTITVEWIMSIWLVRSFSNIICCHLNLNDFLSRVHWYKFKFLKVYCSLHYLNLIMLLFLLTSFKYLVAIIEYNTLTTFELNPFGLL